MANASNNHTHQNGNKSPPVECPLPEPACYDSPPTSPFNKYTVWPKATHSPVPIPSPSYSNHSPFPSPSSSFSSNHQQKDDIIETEPYDPFYTAPPLASSIFKTPPQFRPEPFFQLQIVSLYPTDLDAPVKELPMRPFLTELFNGKKSKPVIKSPSPTNDSDKGLHTGDSISTDDDENVFNRDPRIQFPGIDDEHAFRPEEAMKCRSLHEQFGWSTLDPVNRAPCIPDESKNSGLPVSILQFPTLSCCRNTPLAFQNANYKHICRRQQLKQLTPVYSRQRYVQQHKEIQRIRPLMWLNKVTPMPSCNMYPDVGAQPNLRKTVASVQ